MDEAQARRERYQTTRRTFMDYHHGVCVGVMVKNDVIYATVRPGTDLSLMTTRFHGYPVEYEFGNPARTLEGYA